MSGDEDDYLSDKFLVDASSTAGPACKTYAQLRKEAAIKAKGKNEANKLKSKRQREIESREEGLSKSLFERAKEEEEAGISKGNKALSMMMKMGFKPGQSLRKTEDDAIKSVGTGPLDPATGSSGPGSAPAENSTTPEVKSTHKTEPLPLNEWTGKKGIGLGKRAPSPTFAERIAKMAKMTEQTSQHDYRDRTRQEYEERRAEGKLGPAQRTCVTFDEQAGKMFNVLWLNLNNPETFPAGLMDALLGLPNKYEKQGEPIQARLRRQMQEDALQPLTSDELTENSAEASFSSELIEEAIQFLRLQAQDRLRLVLSYLRDNHLYCFWCGVQYEDEAAMEGQCPGSDEESHD